MENSTERLLNAAINYYGEDNQIDVAIEEMGELIQALIKERRYRNLLSYERIDYLNHVAEELADVSIMIDQLMLIFYDTPESPSMYRYEKLKRLADRIDYVPY